MKKEILNTWNGIKVELKISSDGFCYCPVCGEKPKNKEWRPYDETGLPSYDICSCGFEYGFDDSGVPPYEESWEHYREKWLNGKVDHYFGKKITKVEKLEQLKNIEINSDDYKNKENESTTMVKKS